MGCTSAIVFTCFGAAYGTAKSGVGISAMGVLRPDLIVRSMYIREEAQSSWSYSRRIRPGTDHFQTLSQLSWLVLSVSMAWSYLS